MLNPPEGGAAADSVTANIRVTLLKTADPWHTTPLLENVFFNLMVNSSKVARVGF